MMQAARWAQTSHTIAALFFCLATACVADNSEVTSFVRLANVPAVTASSTDTAATTYSLIRNRAAWEDAWQQLYRDHRPQPPLPDVDFERQMILLASLGRRPSGGYSIAVQDISVTDNTLAVDVLIKQPGQGCIVTTGITVPVDIVI